DAMADDPRFAERFEIFIAGMECGDNWSEQNDPVHLLETWKRNYKPEERDSGEFHALDFDFIEALEYGLPPTTGIGPGLERMAMIFTEQENIDDVIFFPLMKPSISTFNAQLYGVEEKALEPVQDLNLTFSEFASLFEAGAINARGARLTVKPHVRIWKTASQWRATGFVEVEGLVESTIVRVAGYSSVSDKPLTVPEEMPKLVALAQNSIGSPFRSKHPGGHLQVVSND
ncbi:MAG: amino acid--tRNA ligase-related protein, partial [Verrucomicrobiota bacterium]|nr:amino acid--tRNA ligase-related protein [Verrucomicrobiota bacterium]